MGGFRHRLTASQKETKTCQRFSTNLRILAAIGVDLELRDPRLPFLSKAASPEKGEKWIEWHLSLHHLVKEFHICAAGMECRKVDCPGHELLGPPNQFRLLWRDEKWYSRQNGRRGRLVVGLLMGTACVLHPEHAKTEGRCSCPPQSPLPEILSQDLLPLLLSYLWPRWRTYLWPR